MLPYEFEKSPGAERGGAWAGDGCVAEAAAVVDASISSPTRDEGPSADVENAYDEGEL